MGCDRRPFTVNRFEKEIRVTCRSRRLIESGRFATGRAFRGGFERAPDNVPDRAVRRVMGLDPTGPAILAKTFRTYTTLLMLPCSPAAYACRAHPKSLARLISRISRVKPVAFRAAAN